MPNMVMPPGEQHGVGGGLQSLSAFLVTSAKEVMFLPDFVCLFLCLFVCLFSVC